MCDTDPVRVDHDDERDPRIPADVLDPRLERRCRIRRLDGGCHPRRVGEALRSGERAVLRVAQAVPPGLREQRHHRGDNEQQHDDDLWPEHLSGDAPRTWQHPRSPPWSRRSGSLHPRTGLGCRPSRAGRRSTGTPCHIPVVTPAPGIGMPPPRAGRGGRARPGRSNPPQPGPPARPSSLQTLITSSPQTARPSDRRTHRTGNRQTPCPQTAIPRTAPLRLRPSARSSRTGRRRRAVRSPRGPGPAAAPRR